MFAATAALCLSACGASPDSNALAAQELPKDDAAAARFLSRATFGATLDEIERLRTIGYTAWFEEQRAASPTLIRPELEAQLLPDPEDVYANDVRRRELWWRAVLRGEDQLRQRVAWALSQILVVSTQDMEVFDVPLGVAEYQDILVRGAFGNFRDLLEQVTLSPIMGIYLDMLKNAKGNDALNLRPDENFAREVLQLFSIGLVRLAEDGAILLEDGQPIATYDQAVVEGFARVFTGWSYGTGAQFEDTPLDQFGRGVVPMKAFEAQHEPGQKLLLDGFVLPAGLGAEADMAAALDLIFEHGNVGPFLAKHLIQRLVTSNPTPAYIGRVAAVFSGNGNGQRGDLFATVRAVLMDPEARASAADQPAEFGKLREPLLRLASLWRAFDAEPASGEFTEVDTLDALAQGPLEAPSVFNYYDPDFAPSGELSVSGLAAPEFQITTHRGIAAATNRLFERVLEDHQGFPYPQRDDILLDLDPWLDLSSDPVALVAQLDVLLMSGNMSEEMREILELYCSAIPLDQAANLGVPNGLKRVVEAVNLIVTSPEAAVER